MVEVRRKTIFMPLILGAVYFCSLQAFAQPVARVSQCLSSAVTVEKASFTITGKYIYDEDQLRQYLTATCSSLRYEFSLKHGGFRIAAEYGGETWSADQDGHLVQLARGRSPLAPPGKEDKADFKLPLPTAPAAPAAPFAAPARGNTTTASPAPSAVFANDDGDPTIAKPMVPGNGVVTAEDRPGKAPAALVGGDRPDAEAAERMKICLDKDLFKSKPCESLFMTIDQRCALTPNAGPKICMDFHQAFNTIDIPDCAESDDNKAKCEMRYKMVEKRCNSDLVRDSSECRWVNRFAVATGRLREPAAEVNTAGGVSFGSGMGGQSTRARTMEPGLRKLLRMRAVTFERKNSPLQDIGFVGEEVEAIDQALVNYNDRGVMVGIRQDHVLTLTVSSVQELYGSNQRVTDKLKSATAKIDSLEAQIAALKAKLDEQDKTLKFMKLKMGLDH